MTIETVTNKTIQSGNGSNKDFDFAFEIPDEDSLSLTKRGSDGTETAITTNFTVTGIGDEAGGTVNYPTTGSALGASEKIIIKRVVALKQLENLRNQGDYSLEDIEDALDRAVMLCQQLQEQIDRSLKLPLTSSSTYVTVNDFVANKLLYVSSDGTKVKMSDADFGSIQTYLTSLAAIAADISAVAAIDTEVMTIAGISADVTTVAGIAADVTAVADIAADVSAVAAIDTEVATLSAFTVEIAAVYANLSDILNAASFNFPTLSGSDAGKFLKVNAGYNGYDLVASANLTLLGALTPLAGTIPYFDTPSNATLFSLTGAILPFAGSALPAGFLACNGAAISRSTYANLFAALVTADSFSAQTFTVTIASPGVFTKSSHGFLGGERIRLSTTGALPTGLNTSTDYFVVYVSSSTFKLATTLEGTDIVTTGSQSGTHTYLQSRYGLGDGSTTFNLPDLRDQFSRGYSSTRTLGTGQLDAFQGHWHTSNKNNTNPYDSGANSNIYIGTTANGSADNVSIKSPISDGTNGTPRTASETRPVNVALNYCIKY